MTTLKEFVLGTVQLGLPYGINSQGFPSAESATHLLAHAYKSGLRVLDTAIDYGIAAQRIGAYHKSHPANKFNVFSKAIFANIKGDIKQAIQKHQAELEIVSFDGFYFHRADELFGTDRNIKVLAGLKVEKVISKIGLSVYTEEEITKSLNYPEIDILQVPFSIIHSSPKYLEILKTASRSKELYCRSVFLQGLIFKTREELTDKLKEFLPILNYLDCYSRETKISLQTLALSYVLHTELFKGILIGAETIKQIDENIASFKLLDLNWDDFFRDLPKISNRHLLNPGNWK